MFAQIYTKVRVLRPPLRSLVFLYWIFTFTSSLVGIFIQLFLFKQFGNITFNVLALMVWFTGIMVGFVVCGYAAGAFRQNIRYGFLVSFLSLGTSFVFLLGQTSIAAAYLFMFIYGLGNGFFWLTIHTFELTETKDYERDFYSSLLSVGDQLSSFLGPVLATLLLWISASIFHWNSFALLFLVTPFIYLIGFFCLRNIGSYRPTRIEWADAQHFITEKRNRVAQLYLIGGGFQNLFKPLVLPLVALFLLGTEFHVGIYATVAAIISALFLLIVGHYRHTGNRLFILGVTAVLSAASLLWLGFHLNLKTFLVITIATSILLPLMRVSQHVIDLETMESIGRAERDFYPTMIFRDLSLWLWRLLAGLLFLIAIQYADSKTESLAIGICFLAGSHLLTFLGANALLRSKRAPGVINLPV